MGDAFVIHIVDDAEASRLSLASALGTSHTVESFETAEDCLARLETVMPDLFLLDVDLPGMNGFELCQRIRQHPEGATTPVIFISALDDLDSRIEGYEVGGTDFVVKPYKMAEVKQKVEVAKRIIEQESLLHLKAAEASSMVSTILISIGEYAGLINFLRELNTCHDHRTVAQSFLSLLGSYGLDGVIQLRDDNKIRTYSPKGDDRPLEIAVIHKVRKMGRIFEFKTHGAYNYERTTILINNMPVEDRDLCGRIRDNLAIAAESIDAKLEAISASDTIQRLQRERSQAAENRTQSGIGHVLKDLSTTLDGFNRKYALARQRGTTLSVSLQAELLSSFAYLGLSADQEASVLSLVHEKTDELVNLYDFSEEMRATLTALSAKLEGML
ncbi:MAG: hypothetical protein RJA63_2071 [Pseudomonadota bacterium]